MGESERGICFLFFYPYIKGGFTPPPQPPPPLAYALDKCWRSEQGRITGWYDYLLDHYAACVGQE